MFVSLFQIRRQHIFELLQMFNHDAHRHECR
jgi:hypothetical protein